jgi:hypothetical protein
MADTPLAIETLVQRFGGHVCSTFIFLLKMKKKKLSFLFIVENTLGSTGKKASKKAISYLYYAHTTYDAPSIIICSLAEMNAPTPSVELQAYKNMGVSYSCNFIAFIIINTFF